MKRKRKKAAARFIVKRSRPGAGLGLFTRRPIRKGGFILEYTGKHIPTKHADTLDTRYLFEINKKWTVDGSPRSNLARYINHSCKPNCEPEIEEYDDKTGRILIQALRDIEAGEELTYDYGKEYFDEFIRPKGCRCEKCVQKASVAKDLAR